MHYKFYTTSKEAWDGMLEALQESKESIYWECYILVDDEETHKFFDILGEKAKQGVEVRLVVDGLGSFFLSSQARNYLVKCGAEILGFNPRRLFGRNHKKLLIVDRRVAFIGGVNIKGKHKDWLDLHLELKGGIVDLLLRSFVRTYRLAGGKEKINLPKTKGGGALEKLRIKVIEHLPFKKRSSLKSHYIKKLNAAKKEILIATPYFVPHPWFVGAMHRAAKNGVAISIILPERTDNIIVNLANYSFASLIYRPGIDFYFTKEMIHAKALLVDDEGLVGSQNIDAVSFDQNIEGGVIFKRPQMVNDLRNILNDWTTTATKLDFPEKDKYWYHRLRDAVFQSLQPFL